MSGAAVKVYFGGEARELWTDDGLAVTYSGGTELLALPRDERVHGCWSAEAPEPARRGDVKTDMAEYSRARELACRINDGTVAPLTLAYFRAAADAASRVAAGDSSTLHIEGRFDAIILPELLRVLLDERGMSWKDAVNTISLYSVYDTAPPVQAARAAYRKSAPLSALSALQPRTARLISAVNEKLCERLWAAFPGDWQRIASAAVIEDGAVNFPHLAAAMCGWVSCTREERAGALRTFYALMPEKFEDII